MHSSLLSTQPDGGNDDISLGSPTASRKPNITVRTFRTEINGRRPYPQTSPSVRSRAEAVCNTGGVGEWALRASGHHDEAANVRTSAVRSLLGAICGDEDSATSISSAAPSLLASFDICGGAARSYAIPRAGWTLFDFAHRGPTPGEGCTYGKSASPAGCEGNEATCWLLASVTNVRSKGFDGNNPD